MSKIYFRFHSKKSVNSLNVGRECTVLAMNLGLGYLFLAVLLATTVPWRAEGSSETESIEGQFCNEFSRASFGFALDLLRAVGLEDEDNVLLSPVGVAVSLAVLQQGAGGATASQLEKVLHLTAEDSKMGYGEAVKSFLDEEKTNLTLGWGNRGYILPSTELNDTFLSNIEEYFNTTVEEINLTEYNASEAAAKINDWVREVTHDNIKDIIDGGFLTADFVMMFVNAIYFKNVWNTPFEKYKTKHDKFQVNHEHKVEVPFMRQVGRFVAGEDAELGIKWLELPFRDKLFSMIFILPEKVHGVNQVLEKLTDVHLKQIIGDETIRRVKVTIPKFKLSKKILLADTLKKLGLTEIFTEVSDLTGVTVDSNPLRLTHFIQQSDVEVDEEGAIAAAATFAIVQTLSLDWFNDEIDFRADHPFLFLIVDKNNKIPIFVGKVMNPKTSTYKS